MPATRRRGDRVDYVVVERDGVDGRREAVGINIGNPTPTRSRVSRRSRVRRQAPAPTDLDSDDESDLEDLLDDIHTPTSRAFSIPSVTPSGTSAVRLMKILEAVNTTNAVSLYQRPQTVLLPTRVPVRRYWPLCSHPRIPPQVTNAKGESPRLLSIYSLLLVQLVRRILVFWRSNAYSRKGRRLLLLWLF
jgi:hypothetical protein